MSGCFRLQKVVIPGSKGSKPRPDPKLISWQALADLLVVHHPGPRGVESAEKQRKPTVVLCFLIVFLCFRRFVIVFSCMFMVFLLSTR